MKKKVITATVGGVILLIVAVFVIMHFVTPTEEAGEASTYLQSKKAVLYISPEASMLEQKNPGGYLVFIDDKGRSSGYKIDSVVYGGTVVNGEKLLIEQSSSMKLISNETFNQSYDTAEYRGLKTGYLESTNQYYSIYNSGLSKKYDYKMNIRYVNDKGQFQTSFIPHFVSTAGEEGDHLLLLTQDLITSDFQLRTLKLKDKEIPQLITSLHLDNSENLDAISQIVSDDEAYYFVVSDYESTKYENIILYKVDKKSNKVTKNILAKYRTETETESNLPLSYDNSIHKVDDNIYFMNGIGTVYRYNISSEKSMKYMKVNPAPLAPANHAQMQFKDGDLYYIYENPSKQFYLDQYNLASKKRVKQTKIKNLNKYLGKDEKIGIYNLDILSSH